MKWLETVLFIQVWSHHCFIYDFGIGGGEGLCRASLKHGVFPTPLIETLAMITSD